MALEIERKWLVDTIPDDVLRNIQEAKYGYHVIEQAYLLDINKSVLRLRTQASWLPGSTELVTTGVVTVKCPSQVNGAVEEYEMSIPSGTASLFMPPTTLLKTRWLIPYGELLIELDIFGKDLSGLMVAEVEFPQTDVPFKVPAWFGGEVTNDPQFSNVQLLASGLPHGHGASAYRSVDD